MSVNIDELTERDIRNYKRDIESYKRRQGTFLVLGFIFLGLFIMFLIMAIAGTVLFIKEINVEDPVMLVGGAMLMDVGYAFSSLFLIGMIAMFVLRGALFGKKIENRQRVIDEWKEEHK